MRRSAYEQFLSSTHTAESARSYGAYAIRLERDLNINLDTVDLSDDGIIALQQRFEATGAPSKSVGNCMTAARAYAHFRQPA
jgi:hypothetical protein